jgi:hypothetical protein
MRCKHAQGAQVITDCFVCTGCHELIRPVLGKRRKDGTYRQYFVLYRGR